MEKHAQGKLELIRFGEINGVEFFEEIDADGRRYYWFGNKCVVPDAEDINDEDLRWLAGKHYEEIKDLMEKKGDEK